MISKVAFFHNIISPHNNPLFRELARRRSLQIRFFFLSPGDPNRPWKEVGDLGFDYQILPGWHFTLSGKDSFSFYFNPSVFRLLNSYEPDTVVISGWDHPTYWLAAYLARRHHKRLVLWSGSTAYESSWRRTLTLPFVRGLFRLVDCFVAYGSRSRDYLISLGAPRNKISISYNTTDLILYSRAVSLRRARQSALKKSFGLSGKKVLLFYGQLIERKGILPLLQAFGTLSARQTDLGLLVVGNGPLEPAVRNFIAEHPLSSSVKLFPYPGEKGIIKYFAASDLFILPSSEEVWGLVVNQALAAGLPVIATRQAGSTPDLIRHGINGLVIPDNSSGSITNGLSQILTQDLQKMGTAATKSVRTFSPSISAAEFSKSFN